MPVMIVGTVPYKGFPLTHAECQFLDGRLNLNGVSIPVLRGTPALLAATCIASDVLGLEKPRALLAGDIGRGDGSRRVYARLEEYLDVSCEQIIVFHYLQPEVDWHNRILIKLDELENRPLLVADAGYMYVAKMSGFASSYDLFTPDVGEVAFLADESAPHPFYTRGFLLQEEDRVPELIRRAYEHENAARYLLVKGRSDFVASAKGILETISEPCVENMEPIGGTGDTLTGIVAALLDSGRGVVDAAKIASRVNRVMGLLSSPTPASAVVDLLSYLPQAMEESILSVI